MLSPDVPEFVPRALQTLNATSTVNIKPKESTSQPQHTKPPPNTHHSPSHARSAPPFLPKSSPWRGEAEKTLGSQRQNDSWRQPREVSGNQRESNTQTLQGNYSSSPKKKLPERQFSQKSKGKPKTISEDLELHIKNKFVTPKPSESYTKVLKSKQSVNNISETKSSKPQQDFSFSTEDQWPTLGESLTPHKILERTNVLPPRPENTIDTPWANKSNENSPLKSSLQNPWQERGTAQHTADASIRPKITETSPIKCPVKGTVNSQQERGTVERSGDGSVRPKTTALNSPMKRPTKVPANSRQERNTTEQAAHHSVRPRNTAEQIALHSVRPRNSNTFENNVKTKPASHTPQRKAETNYPLSDNKQQESRIMHLAKDKSDKYDKELGSQKSNATSAINTEPKHTQEVQSQEEAAEVTKTTTTEEDSDPFQWKVIGEKKKKVKIKLEKEIKGSTHLQMLVRGDGNKYGRVLPDKPSQNNTAKDNQEYTRKTNKKYESDTSKTKAVHSSSTQKTQGATTEGAVALKTDQKEKKKTRPTKVMSLANCSNDRKETRPNPKIATTTAAAAAAARPLSEKALQRKLAAKLKKKEDRMKLKENKAREALQAHKNSKVSLITSDFLQNAQLLSKASSQPSSQNNASAERMRFSIDEYPTLQIQRPSLPLHTHAHQNSSPRPSSDRDDPKTLSSLITTTTLPQKSNSKLTPQITKKSPSVKGILKADGLISELKPHNFSIPDKDSDECGIINYKSALLSAKEKETKLDYEHINPINPITDFPVNINIAPQKKKVRTNDPIELDLFALAAMSKKSMKKESQDHDAQKLSPAKRKIFEDKEVELHTKKKGTVALPKGAKLIVKRNKKNWNPLKKLSTVKKCKKEKKRREALAVQFLFEQAKLRQEQQQQELLDASRATCETEERTETESVGGGKDTNEPLDTTTKTEASKEEDDKKTNKDEDEEKQKCRQEKTKDCEENKENERSEPPHASLDINSQVPKTEGDANKPELIEKVKNTQHPITEKEIPVPEEITNSVIKDINADEEGKASILHSTEEETKSSSTSTQQRLKPSDPWMQELIDLMKSKDWQHYPREYCHQVLSPEVDEAAKQFLTSLISFQKRHYQRDPTKARIRKRYVCGLKETTKLMGKMSCVIMAPNIQQCEGQGSLDDAVEKLLNQAEKLKVPVVFALSTKQMRTLSQTSSRRVSCFGIINYQGAQDLFHCLMQLIPEAQKQYQQRVANGQCTLPKEGEEHEDEGDGEPTKDMNTQVLAHTCNLLMAP